MGTRAALYACSWPSSLKMRERDCPRRELASGSVRGLRATRCANGTAPKWAGGAEKPLHSAAQGQCWRTQQHSYPQTVRSTSPHVFPRERCKQTTDAHIRAPPPPGRYPHHHVQVTHTCVFTNTHACMRLHVKQYMHTSTSCTQAQHAHKHSMHTSTACTRTGVHSAWELTH